MTTLTDQMNDYLKFKRYNSNFGDLVPLILARIHHINIIVLDISREGTVSKFKLYPRL